MSEPNAFEWLSSELEQRTPLSRIEARGTIRLVLKDLGLDPATVTTHQMQVVIDRLLAQALAKRKIDGADELCASLAKELAERQKNAEPEQIRETAYDFFLRLEADTKRRPK